MLEAESPSFGEGGGGEVGEEFGMVPFEITRAFISFRCYTVWMERGLTVEKPQVVMTLVAGLQISLLMTRVTVWGEGSVVGHVEPGRMI